MKISERFRSFLSMMLISATLMYTGCKKDNPADNEEGDFSFGDTYTCHVLAGTPVLDTVSNMEFSLSAGSTDVQVSRILSCPEPPFPGQGYRIVYTGDELLQAKITCPPGKIILAMRYGYTDGLFNGKLEENWLGMPAMEVSPDSTEYVFFIAQKYQESGMKKSGYPKGSELYYISVLEKEGMDRFSVISLKSSTFLDNSYLGKLNPVLKAKAEAANKAKGLSFAYGNENCYEPFWKPLVIETFWIYHPTVNFKYNTEDPKDEDIAHETGHYFINLLVGNDVQKVLCKQGSFFDNHGIGEVVGREYLVDEYVYFAETGTQAQYVTNQLSNPAATFAATSHETTDFPGIEGFGGMMLYSLVRPAQQITNVCYPGKKYEIPAIGLSYGDVYDIVAKGATGNEQLRTDIESYLADNGTFEQEARFHVALQRIGWSYSVEGTLIDVNTKQPLSGYTVQSLVISDEGNEYLSQDPTEYKTGADGKFKINGSVFGGESTLRFINPSNEKFDVDIDIPWSTLTNSTVNLENLEIDPTNKMPPYLGAKDYGLYIGAITKWECPSTGNISPIYLPHNYYYASNDFIKVSSDGAGHMTINYTNGSETCTGSGTIMPHHIDNSGWLPIDYYSFNLDVEYRFYVTAEAGADMVFKYKGTITGIDRLDPGFYTSIILTTDGTLTRYWRDNDGNLQSCSTPKSFITSTYLHNFP